jgi:hypothetical protein
MASGSARSIITQEDPPPPPRLPLLPDTPNPALNPAAAADAVGAGGQGIARLAGGPMRPSGPGWPWAAAVPPAFGPASPSPAAAAAGGGGDETPVVAAKWGQVPPGPAEGLVLGVIAG